MIFTVTLNKTVRLRNFSYWYKATALGWYTLLFSVFYYFLVWPLKICYANLFTHSISSPKQFSEGKSAE